MMYLAIAFCHPIILLLQCSVVSVGVVIDFEDGAEGNGESFSIGSTSIRILHSATIPSKNETGVIPHYTPSQIIQETCSFLELHLPPCGYYSGVGIATFGPAGVDERSHDTYGKILPGTPKREWRGVDLLTPIRKACGLEEMPKRVGFDTDVNAPAIAEFRHRSHDAERKKQSSSKPLTSLSYVTVGTGVGVGLVVNSKPTHGLLHPEAGHIAVQPLDGDAFKGYSWGDKSPYRGKNTVEGITSSVALTERYLQLYNGGGEDVSSDDAQAREVLSTLPDSHPIWTHSANAISNLCVSLLLITSCQKIVIGGGIMKRKMLFGLVRKQVWNLLNGYLDSVNELSDESKLDEIIVESSWERIGSGLVGAFALALEARDGEEETTRDGSTAQEEREKREFASGVLAGIGLSFGCMLISSLFARMHTKR